MRGLARNRAHKRLNEPSGKIAAAGRLTRQLAPIQFPTPAGEIIRARPGRRKRGWSKTGTRREASPPQFERGQMATITISWSGNGITRLEIATAALADDGKRHSVFRRAINHTGDKAFTRVKRELSREIGASQSVIMKYGRISKHRASGGLLQFLIVSRGGPIPLKHFRATQNAAGVSASPWNNRKLYRHAFIVASAGGHAFWRTGSSRLPIKRIAGPNVPKEMVKERVGHAFEALVASDLPPRVEHEIRAITKGVVS